MVNFITVHEGVNPIRVNVNHLLFYKGFQHKPGSQIVLSVAGATLEVRETPGEIADLLVGKKHDKK